MKKTLFVIILMIALVAVSSGVAVPSAELPMGVWITSINGIPLHQTSQLGQFGIFEVDQGGT